MINVGSDFSGVGAFNQALDSLNINYKTLFACDWDKYARQTYIHNYGEPDYYPSDVYDRQIPKESLDIYMTSPPCQAFSLAGKRKGEKDKRGVLFYNSHEFIVKNKPKYFIFENVKGLLSDDSGKTFNRWLDYLGGKSVNGNPVIFPLEDATPYHIYHKVLNAKNYGVPQNRERVFIVGIRDDSDNNFIWPKPFHLTKRLKDVLEDNVDEKYYLSDKMISYLHQRSDNFNNGKVNYKDENDTASCITKSSSSLDISDNIIKIETGQMGFQKEFKRNDIAQSLLARDYKGMSNTGINVIKVKSATKKGFEIANEGDSINLQQPNSEKRRGRVGKEVAQTLDTSCNQGIICKPVQIGQSNQTFAYKNNTLIGKQNQVAFTIRASQPNGVEVSKVMIGAIRGRNPENPLSREVGLPTEQRLELNLNGTSNALTTVQKDNVVVYGNLKGGKWDKNHEQSGRVYDINGIGATVHTMGGGNQEPKIYNDYSIRRLTPRECFRLMDFPDTFKWPVSNSQAYKQAGNSIVVAVLSGVISKLNL
jgi:DNA (cytosine-5)-methyltransferase 1